MTNEQRQDAKTWWDTQTDDTKRDIMRLMRTDYADYTSGMSIWQFIHEFDSIWREEKKRTQAWPLRKNNW